MVALIVALVGLVTRQIVLLGLIPFDWLFELLFLAGLGVIGT